MSGGCPKTAPNFTFIIFHFRTRITIISNSYNSHLTHRIMANYGICTHSVYNAANQCDCVHQKVNFGDSAENETFYSFAGTH